MGAFVDLVSPGSPADQAGIQNEDIILEFDGREIERSADLPFFVGQNKPGTSSQMLVYRDGQRLNVNVVLGSSPLNIAQEEVVQSVPQGVNPLGLRVADLSREARQVSGLSGVRVVEVIPGPAEDAGIIADDVIVSLNRQEIVSAEQFAQVLRDLPSNGFVPVRIVREGRGTTLALDLD
jgi:serine protease Do